MAPLSAPDGALARLSFNSSSQQPNLLSLFNPEAYYPIFWSLCDQLDIQSIVRLTRTCKRLSGLYQYLEPRLWNIDNKLSRWFQDPKGFRKRLTDHDALVSGSFMVQYFDRVTWNEADFVIFVHGYTGFDPMAKYLSSVEGYEYSEKDSRAPGDYLPEGVFRIWTYYRHGRKLQLIGTEQSPLRTILINFYSTHVVNIMNGHRAYSLYPFTTFIKRKGYMQTELVEWHKSAIQKYVRRGWAIEELLWEHEHGPEHPIRKYRRVADKYAWTIAFDAKSPPRPLNSLLALEYATFQIYGVEDHQPMDSSGEANLGYKIQIAWRPFVSHVLKYEYLYFNREWMSFLGERCTALTRTELRKLADDDRPENWDAWTLNTRNRFADSFQKPDYWTFYDDQVPLWFAQWVATDGIN